MAAEFSYARLQEYLLELEPGRSAVLAEMERYASEHDFPIVGPVSARWMALVARMIGARTVFELGSGYGYSTAWFADAVEKNGGGAVWHTVWDEDLSGRAREGLGAMGFGAEGSTVEVEYLVGEAVGLLADRPGPFDLVFMDIDKTGYPGAIPVIEERLRPGGVLFIDNVIWAGRVLEQGDPDEETTAVRQVTKMLYESPRWEASILPVRDGLLTALRLGDE